MLLGQPVGHRAVVIKNGCVAKTLGVQMAEGVGFEPTRERKPPGGFQDRCLKPLGHPSIRTGVS